MNFSLSRSACVGILILGACAESARCAAAFSPQVDDLMTVRTLEPSTSALSPNSIVLDADGDADISRVELDCPASSPFDTLKLTHKSGAVDGFKVRDFYHAGCKGFLQSLLAIGSGVGSTVSAVFVGANQFPGLMIGDNSRGLIVFVPAGNLRGGFIPDQPR